ncbi:hypothetical protein SSP35_08_02360 [Streptomyces sp. NBRC 110611]|nr:hypothetical protein SSP35_08_02360 [Streptomyces sp. NBRC 110611]
MLYPLSYGGGVVGKRVQNPVNGAAGVQAECRQGCGGFAREGWATADSVAGGS